MTQRPSSSAAGFAAVGAALAAWRMAPAASASDLLRTFGWLAAGTAAFVSVTLAVQSIRSSETRPSPWPSLTGRLIWALRPRSYMVAWGVILVAVWLWGTPHLAIEYPPRPCTYAGLSGIHRVPVGTACPWWKWMGGAL